jgi:hypothetical protein
MFRHCWHHGSGWLRGLGGYRWRNCFDGAGQFRGVQGLQTPPALLATQVDFQILKSADLTIFLEPLGRQPRVRQWNSLC